MAEQISEKLKRPASQYYWGDWFKDLALQTCSLPARGLWHEMNCLMHQGEPYGHLTMPNGKPMGPGQLANLCKITPALCKKLIAELEENGVSSKSDSGAIFSRRMVRDEDLRNRRAAGGKDGAEHGVKGAEAGIKGGRPVATKGGEITPLETPLTTPLEGFEKPPPSSSSSSSASQIPSEDKSSGAAPPPTDREIVFATGVPLITAAGVKESNARSMLAMLCKKHGEPAVVEAITETARSHAGDPVSWLQTILKPKPEIARSKFAAPPVVNAWEGAQ